MLINNPLYKGAFKMPAENEKKAKLIITVRVESEISGLEMLGILDKNRNLFCDTIFKQ